MLFRDHRESQSRESQNRESQNRWNRRGFLATLGLTGVWSAFGGARRARAEVAETGSGPATAILKSDATSVTLATGPFPTFAMPAESRLGVCLLFSGAAQGRGRIPLVRGVERAEIDLPGIGSLEADPGVAQGVYRMLGGLHVKRPVELFGLSAPISGGVEGGAPAELIWEAQLRGASVSTEHLRGYLKGFHACVIGLVADDSRFTGQMSYVEVQTVA